MDARALPPPPLPPPKVAVAGAEDSGAVENRKVLAELENEYMRARHALHMIHTSALSQPLAQRQNGPSGTMMMMAPSNRQGSLGYLSSPVPPPPPPPPAPPLQAPTKPGIMALTVRRPEGMSSPSDKRRRAEAADKYTQAGRALASVLLQGDFEFPVPVEDLAVRVNEKVRREGGKQANISQKSFMEMVGVNQEKTSVFDQVITLEKKSAGPLKEDSFDYFVTGIADPDRLCEIAGLGKVIEDDQKWEDVVKAQVAARTAKEAIARAAFQSSVSTPSVVRQFCEHLTKAKCASENNGSVCMKRHFRKIILTHTDQSLGDCHYLDTCRNMNRCPYIHYELDELPWESVERDRSCKSSVQGLVNLAGARAPPQWVTCDVRTFDMKVLGEFGVIMLDPPWDIHMDLPYGTMGDDEMRKMDIGCLQSEGLIFLWVTGRAMELGRELLALWGYNRVDELIWVKTNQLGRVIRTGRTGHWLNHSKEHCLVGRKGPCRNVNANLDCDVLVSPVRETSRKPDEMYTMLERISPGTRKIEIFARAHNKHPGWISLGNQLDGTYLVEPQVRKRYAERYPDTQIMPPFVPE